MMSQEDLLEQCFQEMEAGASLDEVLKRLPEGAADLRSLLSLAAGLRALPQPKAAPEKSMRRMFQAMRGSADEHRPERRLPLWPRLVGVSRLGRALVGLAVVALIVWAISFARQPEVAQAAVISDVVGLVEVTSADSREAWHTAVRGEHLRVGQRLRTGDGSGATLTFADGSHTRLHANSDVTLAALTGGSKGASAVRLTQHLGRTTYEVRPRGPEAAFIVETPAGAAQVNGTSFIVVDAAGHVRFAVDAGLVKVEGAHEAVVLTAGQATTAAPGRTFGLPTSEFHEQGPITRMQGPIWTIGGVPIRVSDETVITGQPLVGASVNVLGRIMPNGMWLADFVEVVHEVSEGATTASFTGLLEEIGSGVWRVGNATLLVSDQTALAGVPQIGQPVRVAFRILPDGRWQAVQIKVLEGGAAASGQPHPGLTSPIATVTVTPSTGTQQPTPTKMPTPTLAPTATIAGPSDNPACLGVMTNPVISTLAEQFKVTDEEIAGWFCSGFGFGEIRLAYEISAQTGRSVGEIFSLRQAGMGWGEIKIQLGILPGAPTPSATPLPVRPPTDVTPVPPVTVPPVATPPVGPPPDAGPPPWVPGPPTGIPPTGIPPTGMPPATEPPAEATPEGPPPWVPGPPTGIPPTTEPPAEATPEGPPPWAPGPPGKQP